MQNNFGAIERQPDPRDYPLGAFNLDTYPVSYQTDISNIVVENQRKIPACGSHAGAYIKSFQDKKRMSPEYLWKKIKLIDGYAPESGTDMLSIFKTLKNNGVCTADELPNNTDLDLATYTKDDTTMRQNADAQDHKIASYAFQFNPSMADIKKAIYTHGFVIALLRIGDNWWTPAWNALNMPLKPPTTVVSGHFVILYGYVGDTLLGLNEWSEDWGNKGTFTIDASYLPYIVEIGTAIDDSAGRFQKYLVRGSFGLDVYSLQKFLVKNGFGSYTPIGYFGPQTEQSVKNFQKKYGIQQTGTVGPITRGRLNIEYAKTV